MLHISIEMLTKANKQNNKFFKYTLTYKEYSNFKTTSNTQFI